MIRCGECGVEGRDASQFRPYYPSVSAPPVHYCSSCWARREAAAQRQGLAVIGAGLLVALLAAALFDLGQTSQLAALALWVLLFEVVGTVLHELGHLFVARGLGLSVHTLSFGYGIVLATRRVGDLTVELRSVPVCGFVTVAGRARSFPRLRQALVALAGPATNAGLAGLAWAIGVGSWPQGPMEITNVSPWHLAVVVNLAIVCFNLFPLAFPDPDDPKAAWQVNDGLLTLKSLVAPAAAVEGWAVTSVAWEVEALLRRGEVAQAEALIDAEVAARPDSARLGLLAGHVLLDRSEWALAQATFERLSQTTLEPELEAALLAGLASAAMGLGQDDAARLHAKRSLALDPTSLRARLVHAHALLAGEFILKAEAAFKAVLEGSDHDPQRARAAAGLARARLAAGDRDDAERLLALARALDPELAVPEL